MPVCQYRSTGYRAGVTFTYTKRGVYYNTKICVSFLNTKIVVCIINKDMSVPNNRDRGDFISIHIYECFNYNTKIGVFIKIQINKC